MCSALPSAPTARTRRRKRLVGSPAAFRPGESRPDNHLTDGEPGEHLTTFSAPNTTRSAVCVGPFPTFFCRPCRCTSPLHVHRFRSPKNQPLRVTGLYSSPRFTPQPRIAGTQVPQPPATDQRTTQDRSPHPPALPPPTAHHRSATRVSTNPPQPSASDQRAMQVERWSLTMPVACMRA